jgi:hypothetical protein
MEKIQFFALYVKNDSGSHQRITADKREIKDFPKLPSATSFIREAISKMPSAFCLSGLGLRPVTGFVPLALRLSRGKQNCLPESFAFVQPTSFTPSPLGEIPVN